MAKNMTALCAPMSADEFRAIRLRWHLSAETMAKIVGLHGFRAIFRWESGATAVPKTAARLVRILDDELHSDGKISFTQIMLDEIEASKKTASWARKKK